MLNLFKLALNYRTYENDYSAEVKLEVQFVFPL